MSEKLRDLLETAIERSVDMRFAFQVPEFTAGPVELNAALVQVQEVLTELESNLSKAIRAKAGLDRRVTQVRSIWQEAYDKALVAPKKVSFGSDFISGKEKSADANLATFNEGRQLKEAEHDSSFANEAVEIIRLHYYGLDKVRQDVRKRLDMSQTDYYS